MERLSRLSGYSFDTAYLNNQVKWQLELKALLQAEADGNGNRLLRLYAGKYYPYTLEQIDRADSVFNTL
jgi:hypothetical protein